MRVDWENLPQKVDSSYIVVKGRLPKFTETIALDTENNPDGSLGHWSAAYRDESGKLCVAPYYGVTNHAQFDGETIMHNAKWDIRVLRRAGIREPTKVIDTMIAAYCVHPSVRVLTRDLQWIRSGQIKVGDELIGIDEHSIGRKRRAMRPTKVTHVSRRKALCYKVTFSNGKEIIASDDHPWLTNMNRHKAAWRATKELKVGWRMLCPLPTWETDCSYEAGYLAGILDGEGSWTKWNLQIAQKPGFVLSYVERLLHSRHIPYCRYQRKDGCVKLGISCTTNALPLLGSVRAERLIAKESWNGVSPTRTTDPCVLVSSLEFVGEQEVVTLETDIHTFNAEGFWVHNCLGMGFQDVKDSSVKRSGDQMVGGLGLKYLARRHLGMDMREWSEIKNAPAEEIMEYNAQDAVATYLLWEQWKGKVPGHFWTIDMPLLDVIMAMEDRGIAVDPTFLRAYAESLDKRLKEYELPLNPFAPEQIRSYVYGTLGIEPFRFTDTGAPSVDASVLETIDDPVIREILDYKSVAKEKSTYASNYIAQTGADGRLHCEFKQVRTATGRLASANPNLQNVVKEGDMRKLFVAPPGDKIIRVDWKQLELMVFAAITQDPIMLGAIEAGRSIHQETADALGLKYDDGKVINFLMLYGGTPWKISMEFHVPIDQAKEIVKTYYRTYPMVKRYHEEQIERAKADKCVTNYFGRTRRLDAMYASDWRIRQEGEREAINTPVQGAAGDVVKLAMIDLHYKHKAPIILQVHDELLFEIPSRKVRAYAKWLEEYIPTLTDINGVRFPVEVSWGENWHGTNKK